MVKTPKGYFFLGGGLQDGESHIECIKRECVEEAGYSVLVKCEVCSAETYINHPTLGYFHPIQTYYTGDVLFKEAEPKEKDHTFIWVDYDEIKGKMFVKMQNWALERIFEYTSKN